jgi:hypothetical protein
MLTWQDIFLLALPWLALLCFTISFILGVLLRYVVSNRKLFVVIVLTPSVLISSYVFWNYSLWRLPVTNFKTYIQNPIPPSVKDLRGRVGGLKGEFACLSFTIHPDDIRSIIHPEYERITLSDSGYRGMLMQNALNCLYDEDSANIPPLESFELYYYGGMDEDALYYYAMLVHEDHEFVIFEYSISYD